ncbi:MAG: ABC transporter ATP-binding protein [Flavobacteriaceae bacterium]|nr:ABC transporter ATP-binding protein [Flavobacteriaceae bacterium]MDG2314870.1 ABC transporter ATP-binding protein [Flavobacteriaceae bacterium]
MNYFIKILAFAKPYSKFMYLNIFFNVLYALFSALSFLVLMPMLKVLFGKNKTTYEKPEFTGIGELSEYAQSYLNYEVTQYAGEDSHKALLVVISLILIVFLLKNLFNYAAMFFITFLRNGVLKDLRNELHKKTMELPLSYFSEKKKGDVIARITSDVLEIQHSFLSILELLVRDPLAILFTLGAMFLLSIKLTIFVLIFIPLAGVVISLIGKSLKKKSDRVQKEQGEFLSIIEETINGLRIIKGFNAEAVFGKKFKHTTERFYRFSNSLLNRHNLASPVSEFLGIAVIGTLLLYGGQLVFVEQSLDPEVFLTYIALSYGVLTPAKSISKASYVVKKGNAAAERVLEILETVSHIQDPENPVEKKSFDSEIELKDVSFQYEENQVLSSISLTIPKGKTVALVGQSGSGKTTISNLIPRLYDVSKGSILIDGVDIRSITKKTLRGFMGMVTQDSILFNDTVTNNLLFGNTNATREDMIAAAKIANAHDFIMELPEGYETSIGDGGNKLSGGQKQRLSIARAVLKNPPIMILDEATSALDTESEQMVQEALNKMMENRTSLVIAHRLSTIQKADTIVVLQKGSIVEQGKHNELIKKEGVYKKLIDLQSFG